MPCHSTPYYSHVHRNLSMLFWDCSPSSEPNYVDQADQFKLDPAAFLNSHYDVDGKTPSKPPLPTHVVLFARMLPQMSDFLQLHSFSKVSLELSIQYFAPFGIFLGYI